MRSNRGGLVVLITGLLLAAFLCVVWAKQNPKNEAPTPVRVVNTDIASGYKPMLPGTDLEAFRTPLPHKEDKESLAFQISPLRVLLIDLERGVAVVETPQGNLVFMYEKEILALKQGTYFALKTLHWEGRKGRETRGIFLPFREIPQYAVAERLRENAKDDVGP